MMAYVHLEIELCMHVRNLLHFHTYTCANGQQNDWSSTFSGDKAAMLNAHGEIIIKDINTGETSEFSVF